MQGPGLEIRKAGRKDYDGIVSLWTRTGLHYQPSGRDSRANLEREMEDLDIDILVAFSGDRMIGTVIGTNDGRKGWVNRLAVDPDYRGEGVAKALVKCVEGCFQARALKIYCCLINAQNEPSQSLFENIGYDRHPEVVYYSKKLDPDI
jgi:ribosomal protein S18 acetylase RimI-like enzyme